MMKNLTISLIFFILFSSTGYAEDEPIMRCAAKGGFEFTLFLDSVIWNDSLMEGVIEPWNDVLNRNQCHSQDIIGLVDHQDSIRSDIRKAFLNCENEKLPQMKSAYHKITAEIYYVRHVIDGGLLLSLPYNIVKTRVYDNQLTVDRNLIYREMKEKYVKEGMFTERELDDFFLNIEIKYQDRKESYIRCESSSWEGVEKKWKEFGKYFTEDYGGLKQAGEGIARESKELGNEISSIKTVELFTTDDSFVDFIGSFVSAQVNGMPPKKGLTELYAKGKKDMMDNPFDSDVPSPTQSELFNAMILQEHDFEIDKMETEMRAHFSVLYGNSSEGIEMFMNELDGRSNDSNGLLEIIDESFPKLKLILDGTDTMNSRQCPG